MENLALLEFIYLDYEEVSEKVFSVVFKSNNFITTSNSGYTDYYRASRNGVTYRGKITECQHNNHYFIERKWLNVFWGRSYRNIKPLA